MIITIAGTTIGVTATQPASFTSAGYSALTYENIGNIGDAGEHGVEYTIVTFNSIDNRATRKFKSSFDYGLKNLEIAYDPSDLGAIVLKDGVETYVDYSFRITYQDGAIEYFSAKIKSFKRSIGTVNSMRMITVALDVTQLVDGAISVGGYLLSGTDRLLAGTGDLLTIG